jgi:cyclopropane-fatty-acyl-phospholipid synthase
MGRYLFCRFKLLLLACLVINANLFANSEKQFVEGLLSSADITINGDRPWDIHVYNEGFYNRVLKDGSLGLGESFMEGWWESAALDQTIFLLLRADLEKNVKFTWGLLWNVLKAKLFNSQNKTKSLEVIDQHYQLGNDLFQNMLDPLMTYSCGYWKNASNLDEAQEAKYELIAKKLGLKPGMRVLDIGCGWGGFAKYIAQHYGVQVVGITLSENQADYARKATQGLSVEIRVQDYRDLNEVFDRIVEIGMFEHVGPKNYRLFMETVYRSLKDDGLFMLHTIGSNQTSSVCDAWITKYIFPNGKLPSIAQIGKSIEGLFVMEDWHNLNTDYEKTLLAWFQNFDQNWTQIQSSYSDSFYRMWKYYLLACAGGFRARNMQLWQVVLSKNGVLGGYQSVR